MKKKRKQSLNKKAKSSNNSNLNNTNKKKNSNSNLNSSIKNETSIETNLILQNRYQKIVQDTLKPSTIKTSLLKCDLSDFSNCLKPQWLQSSKSDFNFNKKSTQLENQTTFTNKSIQNSYRFNLAFINVKKSTIKNNHSNKFLYRTNTNNLKNLEYICKNFQSLNVNYELISLKLKLDFFTNWIFSQMGSELPYIYDKSVRKQILQSCSIIKHSDLIRELKELLVVSFINLKQFKTIYWLDVLLAYESVTNIELDLFDSIITKSPAQLEKKQNKEQNENKKPRPSYLIERDCHIFGGCLDDDAQDEFFISSGAVYQSWPYVYEPGFQLVPLLTFEETCHILSRSDNRINYLTNDCQSSQNHLNCLASNSFDELPSYSLDNFEINLFHVVNKSNNNSRKQHKGSVKRKKKRSIRKKPSNPPTYDGNNELVYLSSLNSIESCSLLNSTFTDDDEDGCSFSSTEYSESSSSSSDDSESFKAYKKRHEIGLNSNLNYTRNSFDDLNKMNRCCSQLSLSELKENNNFTDSSSFENYNYNYNRKKSSHSNYAKAKSNVRLTNSMCNNEPNEYNRLNNNIKRFLSQHNLNFWQINEENFSFRHHHHQHHNHHQRDQLIYC